jgi:hypothetical protein
LYGCEIWFLVLREEYSLRTSGSYRGDVMWGWNKLRGFITCIPLQILLKRSSQGGQNGRGMLRIGVHKGCWDENLKERDHSETLEGGRIILKSIQEEEDGGVGWIQVIQDGDQ